MEKYQILKNKLPLEQVNELYKETFAASSGTCDLIIKVGVEKIEHKCHRIILATASEFIRNALETPEPWKFPVLILPDVTSETFKYVLNYVYNGEVTVPLEFYAKFVETCQLLEIKGVTNDAEFMDFDKIFLNNEEDITETLTNNENDDDDRSASEIEDVSFDDDSFPFNAETYKNLSIHEISDTDDDQSTMFEKITNFDDEDDDNVDSSEESDDLGDDKDTFTFNKQNFNKNNVKLSLENDEVNRAMKCIRRVYDRINKKPEKSLDEVINDTKFIYKNQKIVKAEHACGFCGSAISVRHNFPQRCWINEGLKTHLVKIHKFTFLPKRPKKSKNSMIKLTPDTKIYEEKKIKQHFRSIYCRLDKKPEDDLEITINKTKLITKGDILISAEHQCGFCQRTFNSRYHQFKEGKFSWISSNFTNHLKNVHKIKFKSSAAEIGSNLVRTNYETRVKNIIRRLYERLNLKPDGDFEEIVDNTKLIVEDGKILRAEHTCGFCKKVMIVYRCPKQNYVNWITTELRLHLIRNHSENKNVKKRKRRQ